MKFTEKWKDSFGEPARTGVWLVWGGSGNGKTSFSLQVAKYLTQYGRVAYNTLEEGASKSFKLALEREQMHQAGNFIIINEDTDTLIKRLGKRRSPDIIIIDSFQYFGLNKQQYIHLKEAFANKLFIFISHAEGKLPEGRTARFVKYDADIKIWIEGHKAFITSRFGGGMPFTVWEEGASEYWTQMNEEL
ncbi:MAG: hypothetical protein M9958_03350 [Chitinophagales bacterium]|nr:hypothetical protein [Chitinophagales bacterium]